MDPTNAPTNFEWFKQGARMRQTDKRQTDHAINKRVAIGKITYSE